MYQFNAIVTNIDHSFTHSPTTISYYSQLIEYNTNLMFYMHLFVLYDTGAQYDILLPMNITSNPYIGYHFISHTCSFLRA